MRPIRWSSGIEPFEADDELYLSEYHGSNHALLHTRFRGEAPGFTAKHWPGRRWDPEPNRGTRNVTWCSISTPIGAARSSIARSGHCRGKYDMRPLMAEYPAVERGSWKLPVYHELLRRGIRWAGRLPSEVELNGRR